MMGLRDLKLFDVDGLVGLHEELVQEGAAESDFIVIQTENMPMLSQKCAIIFHVGGRTFQPTHLSKFLSNRNFTYTGFGLFPLGLDHLIDLVGIELERLAALKIVHLSNDLPSGERYRFRAGVENLH